MEEARYNLATRVMSNGVEVIVAGDKTTLPGEPDVKRVLPSSIYKPVTLKPSTLTNNMMMILPQEASKVMPICLCLAMVNERSNSISFPDRELIIVVASKSVRNQDLPHHIHIPHDLSGERYHCCV